MNYLTSSDSPSSLSHISVRFPNCPESMKQEKDRIAAFLALRDLAYILASSLSTSSLDLLAHQESLASYYIAVPSQFRKEVEETFLVFEKIFGRKSSLLQRRVLWVPTKEKEAINPLVDHDAYESRREIAAQIDSILQKEIGSHDFPETLELLGNLTRDKIELVFQAYSLSFAFEDLIRELRKDQFAIELGHSRVENGNLYGSRSAWSRKLDDKDYIPLYERLDVPAPYAVSGDDATDFSQIHSAFCELHTITGASKTVFKLDGTTGGYLQIKAEDYNDLKNQWKQFYESEKLSKGQRFQLQVQLPVLSEWSVQCQGEQITSASQQIIRNRSWAGNKLYAPTEENPIIQSIVSTGKKVLTGIPKTTYNAQGDTIHHIGSGGIDFLLIQYEEGVTEKLIPGVKKQDIILLEDGSRCVAVINEFNNKQVAPEPVIALAKALDLHGKKSVALREVKYFDQEKFPSIEEVYKELTDQRLCYEREKQQGIIPLVWAGLGFVMFVADNDQDIQKLQDEFVHHFLDVREKV